MFSGGVGYSSKFGDYDVTDAFENGEEFNKEIKLLFAAWGSHETGLTENNPKFFDEIEKTKGIKGVSYVHEGWHEWDVWRHAAYEYMQRLF